MDNANVGIYTTQFILDQVKRAVVDSTFNDIEEMIRRIILFEERGIILDADMSYTGISAFPIYAGNEPKSVLARELGDCRDNHEKPAKRVSYGLRGQRPQVYGKTANGISQEKERAYAERM